MFGHIFNQGETPTFIPERIIKRPDDVTRPEVLISIPDVVTKIFQDPRGVVPWSLSRESICS